jgi:hypothetical protein
MELIQLNEKDYPNETCNEIQKRMKIGKPFTVRILTSGFASDLGQQLQLLERSESQLAKGNIVIGGWAFLLAMFGGKRRTSATRLYYEARSFSFRISKLVLQSENSLLVFLEPDR